MGARLKWIRKKLGMTQIGVSRGAGIPNTNLHDREEGMRTDQYEEILILARFLDRKWQNSFKKNRSYPEYDKKQVTEISAHWLFYGKIDEHLEQARRLLNIAYEDFKAKLLNLENEIEKLKG